MNRVTILCVEDESEVRDAVIRDLECFAKVFRIEAAEDEDDARDVLKECDADGDPVGLVLCDHMLPGETGVDFLVELHANEDTAPIRKVLITGQAGQEDTIRAVNDADLHHYIAKPWTPEQLQGVVKEQLTEYVLEQADNLLPFVEALDAPRLMEAISHRRSDR